MGQASLLYIFLTFLKLGATAFGGYMSLIAIVQKQLVEVDKKLKEEDLLDGISLTSVLPGPCALFLLFCWLYFFHGCIFLMAIFRQLKIYSAE